MVVRTGRETEFGRISEALRLRPPETEFERGVRRFGYLLLEVTLLLVLAIFAINVYLHRPVLDSFLFSLALAVGLTPQLLPAIISVNLAHGARRMAQQRVIVRRLASIENFGSMNVLCSDKTGTLTEGEVRLHSASMPTGRPSEKVRLYAYLNAAFQSGFANPIDEAISPIDATEASRLPEARRGALRLRPQAPQRAGRRGRPAPAGDQGGGGDRAGRLHDRRGGAGRRGGVWPSLRPQIERLFAEFSGQGLRTLGVAYRDMGPETGIHKGHESGMTFLGLLVLDDPLRAGIVETLQRLLDLGIAAEDHHRGQPPGRRPRRRPGRAAGAAGPHRGGTATDERRGAAPACRRGRHLRRGGAEPEGADHPGAEEGGPRRRLHGRRDQRRLGPPRRRRRHLGRDAVDVAKEAADIVLLEKDLGVLEHGVREGRATFANTLKYVFMATSANFGNMFSMAGASLFLPFLPLLPKQVLLTNLLTDLPEMTIATDRVDAEMVERPRRWDIGFIRRFMVVFGLVSSVFDFLTFGVLLLALHATPAQFRTGWFVESVVSASLIVLVVRTRRPFFRSRPGRPLLLATLLVIGFALLLPHSPLAPLLGFGPLPPLFLVALGFIVLLYMATAEGAKAVFYRGEAPKAGCRDQPQAGPALPCGSLIRDLIRNRSMICALPGAAVTQILWSRRPRQGAGFISGPYRHFPEDINPGGFDEPTERAEDEHGARRPAHAAQAARRDLRAAHRRSDRRDGEAGERRPHGPLEPDQQPVRGDRLPDQPESAERAGDQGVSEAVGRARAGGPGGHRDPGPDRARPDRRMCRGRGARGDRHLGRLQGDRHGGRRAGTARAGAGPAGADPADRAELPGRDAPLRRPERHLRRPERHLRRQHDGAGRQRRLHQPVGALCTAILDWSLRELVGFSAFVSIGSMLDVGWGDLIDYLGDDPYTKCIIIYMESIGDARQVPLGGARGGADQADHRDQGRADRGGGQGGGLAHRHARRQ